MRCSYALCKSDFRYKHKAYMKNVEFVPFPKPDHCLSKCQKWIHACGRANFTVKNITRNTYICTKHFVGENGPTKLNPHPVVFCKYKAQPNQRRTIAKHYLNKENEAPSEKAGVSEDAIIPKESDAMLVDADEPPEDTPQEVKTVHTQGTQTLGRSYIRQLFQNIKEKRSVVPDTGKLKMSYDICKSDDSIFKFLCGLSVKNFNVLYNFMGPQKMPLLKKNSKVSTPKRHRCNPFSYKDKLFLTLIRIRRGFTVKEIAIFFNTTASFVSETFYVWVQFLYLELQKFKKIMFIDRFRQKQKPACFRPFKDLRVIIDCTEVKIQMPNNFKQQGNTHSSYKHANTVKFLVGISTSGAIIYVSDGFEGAISDREICVQSDFLNYLVSGDKVMGDRGFNIKDILDERIVQLIIPPFLMGRNKLSAQEEILTKQIAKARVHVERMILKIKCFRLLSKVIPITLLPLISQLFYIAALLVNFENASIT